jgi:hypothetical protein
VTREGRVDQVAPQLPQALEGACVIETDQPAVPGHVSTDDSDQLASMILQDNNGLIAQFRSHRESSQGFRRSGGNARSS